MSVLLLEGPMVSGDMGPVLDALAAVAIIATLSVVVILVVLPLIAFVGELVLIPAAVFLALKPWTIEATTQGPRPESNRWRVRGLRASKRAIEEVARELRAGVPAAPEEAE